MTRWQDDQMTGWREASQMIDRMVYLHIYGLYTSWHHADMYVPHVIYLWHGNWRGIIVKYRRQLKMGGVKCFALHQILSSQGSGHWSLRDEMLHNGPRMTRGTGRRLHNTAVNEPSRSFTEPVAFTIKHLEKLQCAKAAYLSPSLPFLNSPCYQITRNSWSLPV